MIRPKRAVHLFAPLEIGVLDSGLHPGQDDPQFVGWRSLRRSHLSSWTIFQVFIIILLEEAVHSLCWCAI